MFTDPTKLLFRMSSKTEVVITGIGVVSPIGIGREAFAESLRLGRSGVGPLQRYDPSGLPVRFAAEVTGFDPRQYVRPRKSLKVMSHDIQLGFAAASLAYEDADIEGGSLDPERLGVVFGSDMLYCDVPEIATVYRSCIVDGAFQYDRWGPTAMNDLNPLWMLKYLPNMSACHIGIAYDARGPNNSITHADISSTEAISEAAGVIERGLADVMFTGGTGTWVSPTKLSFHSDAIMSHREDDPQGASRPFDADRDGMVNGEGAAALMLESRHHAESRGAKILARISGYALGFEARGKGGPWKGTAVRSTIQRALGAAGISSDDVGHVNANGLSTRSDDAVEAQAIRDMLGRTPVTALKSYFGNTGAGSGAMELLGSVLAFEHGEVPATLNYETPDDDCPINVIHGAALPVEKQTALVLSQAMMGQAAAIVLHGPAAM